MKKERVKVIGAAARGPVVEDGLGKRFVLAEIEDGKPIDPDVQVVDVRSLDHPYYELTHAEDVTPKAGPAKVASAAFRANYDGIFSTKRSAGKAN